MEINKQGFVIKRDGQVEVFSTHSALSGEKLGSSAVTVPVPKMPGLFFRISAGEFRQLTEDQRVDIIRRAKVWYTARQPAPPTRTGEPPVPKSRDKAAQEKEK
jgi:cold shock CspA family protein